MEVEFTATDLIDIATAAESRSGNKLKNNVRSKKYDVKQSEFALHYHGMMGEWAVSKATGCDLDMTVHARGDDGVDAVVNGWACHIKTTTYGGGNPDFLLDSMDCFTAEVGILAQIVSPVKVNLCGCIGKGNFVRLHTLKDYGYGQRLVVKASQMTPFNALLKFGKEKGKNE